MRFYELTNCLCEAKENKILYIKVWINLYFVFFNIKTNKTEWSKPWIINEYRLQDSFPDFKTQTGQQFSFVISNVLLKIWNGWPGFFLWSKIPFEINKVVLFASVYNLLLSSYVVYISVNVLPRIFGKKFGNGFELFKVVHWCICLILYFKVSNTAIQKNDPLSSFMDHMTHIYAQKFIIFKTLCVFVCVW